MSNKSRGCNYERQLVDLLHDAGFAAVRVAGSGAMPLPCPDIVACRRGMILAIECKTTRKNQVYISNDQMDDLNQYSKLAGAKPLVAVRFPHHHWSFFSPSTIPKTDGSVYVVSRQLAARRGLTLADLDALAAKGA